MSGTGTAAGAAGATGAIDGPWRAVGPERLELGEGARHHGDGFVAVDLLAGRLLEVGSHGLREVLALDVPLGAVAPRAGGGWIAAAGTGIALLDADGGLTWLATPEADATTPMRMNDGVADPGGRFWAGSMAYDGTAGAGSLYRVDPDLAVTRVLTGLTVPNGPAFDADGTTMYLADSAAGVIRRHDVDTRTGALGEGSVFARVEGASPDGMTVDAEGHLWSALWGGSRLHRYAPDGTLVETIAVDAHQPTSVAIAPDPPHDVLVTTATHGLDPTDLSGDDGRLLTARARVAGLPVCWFG